MKRRIGIDVGGTNTDAVVLERDGTLLARAKVPTTADVTGGIRNVIDAILGGDAGTGDAGTRYVPGTVAKV